MSIALSSPTLIYHNISPTIFINHGVPSLTHIYPREDARFVGMGEGYFQIFGKFKNLPPPPTPPIILRTYHRKGPDVETHEITLNIYYYPTGL